MRLSVGGDVLLSVGVYLWVCLCLSVDVFVCLWVCLCMGGVHEGVVCIAVCGYI